MDLPISDIAWKNIRTELSLLRGQLYSIVNTGSYPIFVNGSAATPEFLAKGASLPPGGSITLSPSPTIDYFLKSVGGSSSVNVRVNEGVIKQDALLLNRPLTDNGLPTGNASIIGDGSSTPILYYLEALSEERLAVARIILNISSNTDIANDEYGDQAALTNGIKLVYRRDGVDIDASNILPIKKNEHWGRWCFDAEPIPIGSISKTFRARWTFTRYGKPEGIILEEGDRLGVLVQDSLTGLADQTIIAEGVHLGVPSPSWITLI